MSSLYSKKWLVAVLVLSLALAACGSDKNDEKETTDVSTTDLTVQLDWLHTVEFAGFYMANSQDIYADNHLDVEFVEGGFSEDGAFISPVDQVLNGQADFGVDDGDQLILARAQGKPVIAIATIYQRSPLVLMSLAENNIQRPEDLIGKSIEGFGIGPVAFLNSQDLTDKVDYRERSDFTNDALISGDVDVLEGFITDQPISLENDGYEINTILLSDYGFDIYPNVIFTTEAMLKEQPELVERFLKATLEGYQLAIDRPQTAAEETVKQDNSLVLDFQLESMQISIPLIIPMGSQPGMMTLDAWEYTQLVLIDQELLSEPIDISQVYTLDVLNAVYSN